MIDSPPYLQHPGYPRAIGDILEHGAPDERRALIAWLRCMDDFTVFREIPPIVVVPAPQPSTEVEVEAYAAANR